MFGFWKSKKSASRAAAPAAGSMFEVLESRTMLSAVVSSTMHMNITVEHNSVSSATTTTTEIEGYTPSQIATAYDLSGITFDSGTVSGDGAGQTIAIVDAYNDPNITSDLATFDSEFDIAAPTSFSVVNQSGGKTLPSNNADWDAEISLDVEWAHAMAPGANIVLVEASSDSTTDLMDAVNYARNISGVSVVSMSWGGSEFFSWGGGEDESQTDYDPILTTPSGHQGVTFVVAAGDSGTQEGVEWPASSPTVLSVGGTTLYTSDDSGTYDVESGWSGTSGGYSQVESEPSYQDGVQDTGARSVPDVSYDADPNTGFAVYDSVADDGYSGWQEVGGTSAGAPQWAAIVAIADQGRVLSGQGTLDGASQTLPDLYSLYGAYGTSAYSSYTTYFNDVLSGGSTGTHFRWGGFGDPGSSAEPGYDTITGLGTPKGAALIGFLAGSGSDTSGGGGGTTTGGGGGGTTTTTLPASPVSIAIDSDPPSSIVAGKTGSILIALTNTSDSLFNGPVTVTIYASSSQTISSSDVALKTFTLQRVLLKPGGVRLVKTNIVYSTSLPNGSYYLTASLTAVGDGTAAATAASGTEVTVSQPFADLSAAFASGETITVVPDTTDSAIVTITNLGNVAATGKFTITLYASSEPTLNSDAQTLLTWTSPRMSIAAGRSVKLKLKYKPPTGETVGSYYLLASLTSSTAAQDSNTSNDLAVALAI